MDHNHHSNQNMSHDHENHTMSAKDISWKTFIPLILIFVGIILVSILYTWATKTSFMFNLMGIRFLVFATFKLVNRKSFAESYTAYDLIAQRAPMYGYIYPLIEVVLGIAYLRGSSYIPMMPIYRITIILMGINSAGVGKIIQSKRTIQCACIGTFFKLPITYVTLAENAIMALMAIYMISML